MFTSSYFEENGTKRKRFSGSYVYQVDSKGRVSIPAKFRETLEKGGQYNKFMLIKGMGGCIALMTIEAFKEIEGSYNPSFSDIEDYLAYQRLFLSSIREVNVDSQGRIMIPRDLLEELEIDKEVRIIGLGYWMEIWSEKKFSEYKKKVSRSHDEMAKSFFELLIGRKTNMESGKENEDTSVGDG